MYVFLLIMKENKIFFTAIKSLHCYCIVGRFCRVEKKPSFVPWKTIRLPMAWFTLISVSGVRLELALASLPFLRSAPTGRLKAEHVEIILKHLIVTDQARILGNFFFNDSGSQLNLCWNAIKISHILIKLLLLLLSCFSHVRLCATP